MATTRRKLTISECFVGVAEEVYGRVFWVISTLGLPPSFIVRLEVAGGRTGRARSTVLITAQYEGQRYLVSVLGGTSEWVRDVRAANGNAVVRHGRAGRVRLDEVPVEERGPILRAYLKWALGARSVLLLGPGSLIEEFRRIAPDHPVFGSSGCSRPPLDLTLSLRREPPLVGCSHDRSLRRRYQPRVA